MSYSTIILGAGESGVGAALLAKAKGLSPFVSDLNPISPDRKKELDDHKISYEESGHSEEIILGGELIIKSPGIPFKAPLVLKALEKGILVVDELEFAARFTEAKFIAITGTNGKTTTTLLTYHLLKEAGLNVGLAGNVGHSLAKQVLDKNYDYFVLEVSSYQLDGMYAFKADVGMLLNITPDHMDRYENDFQKYVNSKFRILQNMASNDTFIYWKDDPVINKELDLRDSEIKRMPVSMEPGEEGTCAFLEGNNIVIKGDSEVKIETDHLPLVGKHNLINSMVAMTAAWSVGLSKEQLVKGLKSFKNAPHRLEKVASIHEVNFVNDSKATNVDAVYYALEGIKAPIVWIAGGVDKGNDYEKINRVAQEKVKALICLGTSNEALLTFFGDKIPSIFETQDMGEAVRMAQALSFSGDTVLLSPACASFDLFDNYEHRGDRFREEVNKLKSENGHRKEVLT